MKNPGRESGRGYLNAGGVLFQSKRFPHPVDQRLIGFGDLLRRGLLVLPFDGFPSHPAFFRAGEGVRIGKRFREGGAQGGQPVRGHTGGRQPGQVQFLNTSSLNTPFLSVQGNYDTQNWYMTNSRNAYLIFSISLPRKCLLSLMFWASTASFRSKICNSGTVTTPWCSNAATRSI